MSCECYQIGGPWITYDPSCPAHGDEAQREAKVREAEDRAKDERIQQLEDRVKDPEKLVSKLNQRTMGMVRLGSK